MTKFSQALKAMLQSRLRMVTRMLALNLLVVILSFIFTLFSSQVRDHWSMSLFLNAFFWILIFAIAIIIRTAWVSRSLLRSNRYQLIPIKENQLYLADLTSSVISFIYAYIIQWITMAIFLQLLLLTITHDDIGNSFTVNFQNGTNISSDFSSTILSVLSPILIVILIHFIDFFSTIILDYIPGGAQKFIKVLVYIVVITIAIYIFFNIGKVLFSLFNGNLASITNSIWLADSFLILLILIISTANIILLKRLETVC